VFAEFGRIKNVATRTFTGGAGRDCETALAQLQPLPSDLSARRPVIFVAGGVK